MICVLYHIAMSGAAATDSSSSGSDSDDPSSSSSDSEQGSESGKCVQEAGPASGPDEEEEVASGAGAGGAGASAPPPDPDAVSLDPSIKKRNRNTENWLLLNKLIRNSSIEKSLKLLPR